MNKLLYVIFTVQLVLVTIADVLACVWLGTAGSEWYLKQPGNATNSDTGYQLPNFIGYWFTFFGLFNNFVPMFVRCVVWCAYPSGKLGAQIVCAIAFRANIDCTGTGDAKNLTSFLINIHTRVRRSLYVTLETVSVFHSVFINKDPLMYDEESNIAAACRSTNLCQEIGQVEYVFRLVFDLITAKYCVYQTNTSFCVCSDKTGTLTRNEM